MLKCLCTMKPRDSVAMCQGGLSRVPNDRLFTASPRERMGSNHPNSFTQANTRLVEGLELQLPSLV